MPERVLAPAAMSPTTCSVTGSSAPASRGVDGAHGVAVHRGVVEAGQREVGADVLGQQQPLGVEQGQLDRVDRADAVEHDGEVLVDRAQSVITGHLQPLVPQIDDRAPTAFRVQLSMPADRRATGADATAIRAKLGR